MASISWTSTERDKVRLLAGIESEELDNSKLDILLNLSVDWFEQQTGITFGIGNASFQTWSEYPENYLQCFTLSWKCQLE